MLFILVEMVITKGHLPHLANQLASFLGLTPFYDNSSKFMQGYSVTRSFSSQVLKRREALVIKIKRAAQKL
jgi:hypothetical protein